MYTKLILSTGLAVGLAYTMAVDAATLFGEDVSATPQETGDSEVLGKIKIDDGPVEDVLFIMDEDGTFRLADLVEFQAADSKGPFGRKKNKLTLSRADGDTDPFANLAIGVVDNGAPSRFAVYLHVPLADPILGLATWSTSVAGSWTDFGLTGGNGGAINTYLTPGIDWFGVNGLPAVAGGTGTTLTAVGPAVTYPAGTSAAVYGPYNGSGTFDCATLGPNGCVTFDLLLNFRGSGGGDAYSFTAGVTIDPLQTLQTRGFAGSLDAVPEPSMAALLGSGLLAMGWRRRCRRTV